jgi:hypothetical protein
VTVDSGEIVAILGAIGGLFGAVGAGLYKGLAFFRDIAKDFREFSERMHDASTKALTDCAVAMSKQAESGHHTAGALSSLSKAVDGLTSRVSLVERHVEAAHRVPTARFDRDAPEQTRVEYEPAMRTRP